MDRNAFISELRRIFSLCGLGELLGEDVESRLFTLSEYLVSENEKYNLTAVTDQSGIILRHLADSASLSSLLTGGASLLDVGCGAGFPSLVLAILRPDLSVTALDATEKRVRYVASAAELLGLSNLTALCLRAEDGAKGNLRESFDFVTARAVARLPILSELCLPYVKMGGAFLAMKGSGGELELSEAGSAISVLGGKTVCMHGTTLTDGLGETLTRTVAEIRKISHTPALYPRHFSRISKKPL